MFEIKAGGVSHLTDARYFGAKGVKWIGFDLDDGRPEMIARFEAIREWVAGPQWIGEFAHDTPAATIIAVVKQLALTAVQLTPFHSDDAIAQVAQTADVWLSAPLSLYTDTQLRRRLSAVQRAVSALVVVPDHDAVSDVHLTMLAAQYAVWVRPVNTEQARLLLEIPHLRGLELLGSSEEKTGFKSFDDLDEIFDLLPDAFA